jgi:hypothetical protein
MLHVLPRGRLACGRLAGAAAAAARVRASPPPPHVLHAPPTAAAGISSSAIAAFGVAMPPMGDPSKTSEVLVEDMVCMRAAVLNRPAALNAVNLSMVERLTELYAKCVRRA